MRGIQTPLARLMLFVIGLAIAAGIVTGVLYIAVDLPQQKDVQSPMNRAGDADCIRCLAVCEQYVFSESRFTGCVRDCYRCECSKWECSDR